MGQEQIVLCIGQSGCTQEDDSEGQDWRQENLGEADTINGEGKLVG